MSDAYPTCPFCLHQWHGIDCTGTKRYGDGDEVSWGPCDCKTSCTNLYKPRDE